MWNGGLRQNPDFIGAMPAAAIQTVSKSYLFPFTVLRASRALALLLAALVAL